MGLGELKLLFYRCSQAEVENIAEKTSEKVFSLKELKINLSDGGEIGDLELQIISQILNRASGLQQLHLKNQR